MNFTDPVILAGISAITSIITTLLIKPWIDNKFHQSKLGIDFKAEQQKKIKEVLGKYKVHLIKVCDEVNHRYWNFTENYDKSEYKPNGEYLNSEYPFKSYIYRVLVVFAWIKIVEDDLIYLDTTIASKEELDLIKYFRLLRETITSTQIFKGFDPKYFQRDDHFSRYDLDEMIEVFVKDKNVIPYSEFKSNFSLILPVILPFCKFLDGINPQEDRLRWDRFQLFHFTLIGFLNSYGYDFQRISENVIKQNNKRVGKNKLLHNLQEHIEYFKLGNNKEILNVIRILKSE